MTLETALQEHVLADILPPPPAELWVIDATALLFRAYYSCPPRRAADGVTPVGAVLGLGHLLRRLLRRRPEHVALVYDAGRATFRTRLDPRYKANRGEPPPDLVPQFDLALRLGEAAGFATYSVPDYEADDLMATLARQAGGEGMRTRLLGVDKDLCQLVRDEAPAVVVEDPKSGEVCDAAGVLRRMGVPPRHVVDLLALVGDSVDNVPGVAGVGPKSAVALVQAFGDLDRVYAALDRVPALPIRGARALAAKLAAGREAAYLARDLVRLHDAAPVDAAPADEGPGRASRPLAAADLRTRTRWRGPGADADEFFAALGSPGTLRGLRMIHEGL